MGARLSEEMKTARKLMKTGTSAAETSRQTGLTAGALSQDCVCRIYIDEQKAAKKAKSKERQSK